MKTKTIEVCDGIFIDVTCAHNDPVDIRCGGPATIGYEFIISPDEDVEDMTNFIKSCLKKYRRPLIGIDTSTRKDFPVEHLWTKERIEKCIKENSLGI